MPVFCCPHLSQPTQAAARLCNARFPNLCSKESYKLSRGVVEKHVAHPYASWLHWSIVSTWLLVTLFILQVFLLMCVEVEILFFFFQKNLKGSCQYHVMSPLYASTFSFRSRTLSLHHQTSLSIRELDTALTYHGTRKSMLRFPQPLVPTGFDSS